MKFMTRSVDHKFGVNSSHDKSTSYECQYELLSVFEEGQEHCLLIS